MKRTVYAVAFKDGKFLMIYHTRRKGWEMPGGSIEDGETPEQAAAREYMEEAGYNIEIIETRDIGYCDVCACLLGDKMTNNCEMESRLYSEIPEELFFDRKEYEMVIPWAYSVVYHNDIDKG